MINNMATLIMEAIVVCVIRLIYEADVTVKLAVLHILFLDIVRVFVKQLSYLLHGAAMRTDKCNQLTYKLVVSCVFMHILTALRWYLYAEALIFCGDLYLTYGVSKLFWQVV